MFKSIRGTLDKRQQTIGHQSNAADITQQAVMTFLQQNYSDSSVRISVRYHEQDETLTIVTPTKTLAGELMLHIPELVTQLSTQGVRVKRILVR